MAPIFRGSAPTGTTTTGDALSKSGILTLKYPVRNGVIDNWDDAEKLMHHCMYNELRVAPEEHPIIMLDSPLNLQQNREKTVQVMFETFSVPLFHLVPAPVAALAATCRSTGLVLSSGGNVTHAVPVVDGEVLRHNVRICPVSGNDITNYLMHMLSERGISLTTKPEIEFVRDMKHELCFVVQNFEQSLKLAQSSNLFDQVIELPDGVQHTVGKELFCSPELLFRPSLMAQNAGQGIAEAVTTAIQSCPVKKDELYSSIVLSGGSTMFPGLSNRLQRELERLTPATMGDIFVIARSDRIALEWIGASMIAHNASTNQNWSNWITKDQYDEFGPAIVSRSM